MVVELAIEQRVSGVEGRMEKQSRLFDAINSRLTLLDEKFEITRHELDAKIESVRQKLLATRRELDAKIGTVGQEFDAKIEALRRDLSNRFRWLIGLQITTWITVIIAILLR